MGNKPWLQFRKSGLLLSPKEMLLGEIVSVFSILANTTSETEEGIHLTGEFNTLCDFYIKMYEDASLSAIAMEVSQKYRISYKKVLRDIWQIRLKK